MKLWGNIVMYGSIAILVVGVFLAMFSASADRGLTSLAIFLGTAGIYSVGLMAGSWLYRKGVAKENEEVKAPLERVEPEPTWNDYDWPKQPLNHTIAAREQGVIEEPRELGRPKYAIYKDGFKYKLVDDKGKADGKTLFGYPIVEVEDMPPVGSIELGDLRAYIKWHLKKDEKKHERT